MSAKDASENLRQNRAASWTAGAIGLVLIGLSAPFTVALWDEGASPLSWQVAWDQATAGESASASLTGLGTTETSLNVTGIPAFLLVELACTDAPLPGPLGQAGTPAQVEAVLYEGETLLESRAGTCAELSEEPWNVTAAGQPALDEVNGIGREDAEEELAEELADDNRTVTYRLTLSATRDSAVPNQAPLGAFSADARLSAALWQASVVERAPEVVR